MPKKSSGDGSVSPEPVQSAQAAPPLVIFVHGIRDPGFWQQKLKSMFEQEGFVAVPIGYGVLDVFRFLLGFRKRSIDIAKNQILTAIRNNPGSKVTIIAHSFGTYAVSRLLEENPSIEIANLVMCGAIVKRGYRWDKTVNLNAQGEHRMRVINEHSARDIWPLFARHATFGFGDVGSIGCQDADVIDRRHDVKHSEYLTETFAAENWVRHLAHGEKLKTSEEPMRTPWYFVLTRLPFTFAQVASIAVVALGSAWIFDRLTFHTAGELAIDSAALGSDFTIEGYAKSDSLVGEPLYSIVMPGVEGTRRLLSINKYDRIDVTIKNRIPLDCNINPVSSEYEDRPEPQRSLATQAVFSLSLRDARRFFGKAKISFEYIGSKAPLEADFKDRPDGPTLAPASDLRLDQLIVKAGDGIDYRKIKVKRVNHTGDDCLDDMFKQDAFVRIIPDEAVTRSWLGLLAWAQDTTQVAEDIKVRKLLKSRDVQLRKIGVETVLANPKQYSSDVNAVINSGEAELKTVTDLLLAAKSAGSTSIKLDPRTVLQLTYSDDNQVRDAARSYLRQPGIVSDDVLEIAELVLTDKLPLLRDQRVADKPFNKDYLLLIAIRDIYYNIGIDKLNKHLDSPAGNPDALKLALATFSRGEDLMAFASSPEQRAALSKNTYGKAMAEYRGAAWSQAIRESNPSGFILGIRGQSKPLADQTGKASFAKFLNEVEQQASAYPWPHHIAQARQCTADYTFDCLADPTSSSP
jgi:pimeloyl-ACP methyl ester carboxylesterase